MGKIVHFRFWPLYGQIIDLLQKSKILTLSRQFGGERYIKQFSGFDYLVVMLYSVIMRCDSLREITINVLVSAQKLRHLGVRCMPRRSTLSDANARRPAEFFEAVYRDLYQQYRDELSADSRAIARKTWENRLHIIDSTTISLFSNLIFKGSGRNPKFGRKKGGIKAHCSTNPTFTLKCLHLLLYKQFHLTTAASVYYKFSLS